MDDRSRLGHALERSCSEAHALQAAESHATDLGFGLDLRSTVGPIRSSTCKVTHISGKTSIGHGKGLGGQSAISATFEAFEHFHYRFEDRANAISSQNFVVSTNNPACVDSSPDFISMMPLGSAALSCFRYEDLEGSGRGIEFPVVLSDPFYEAHAPDERETVRRFGLKRYATNSGTSIGCDEFDAKLHGLLELIERDAIGICLTQCILRTRPLPVRRIVIESLPLQLRLLVTEISSLARANLTIWDITTDIGVPCILCSLEEKEFGRFRFFGSGASLFREYAIERAMLEALQGFHIQFDFGIPLQSDISLRPQPVTRFQMCDLDGGFFNFLGGEISVQFREVGGIHVVDSSLDVSEQLSELFSRLRARGIAAYSRTLHRSEVIVVQVVAPKLERIYLLSHGVSVGPGSRARYFRECS